MSSRYLIDLKTRKSKIIHVYRNGDKYSRAALILLRPIEQKELERIFRAVEEKITLPNNKPIKRIFTIDGDEVEKPWQIEDQSFYVVGSTENFIKTHYGTTRYWTILGPVRWSKCREVIYEPPEKKETLASRSTFDEWKLQITRTSKPSIKMTKSMSAVPHDQGTFRKNKKMTLSVGQVNVSSSDLSKTKDTENIPQDDSSPEKRDSLEINNTSADSLSPENNQHIEKFLNDTVNISQQGNLEIDSEKKSRTDLNSLEEKSIETDSLSIQNKKETEIISHIDLNKTKAEKEEICNDKDDTIDIDEKMSSAKEESEENKIQNQTNEYDNEDEDEKSDDSLQEKEKAALLIQAHFRGNIRNKFRKDDQPKHVESKDDYIEQKIEIDEKETSCNKEINNNDCLEEENDLKSEERAAILIQSSFRGHVTRKKLKQSNEFENSSDKIDVEEENNFKEENNVEEENKAATLIHCNFRGYEVRKELRNSSESKENHNDYSESSEDMESKERAATVIQSRFRGHMTREKLKQSFDDEMKPENVTDYDGTEEDVKMKEKSAVVIQSNFRGHMVRKKIKDSSTRESFSEDRSDYIQELEEEDETEDLQRKEHAATVIQSNFRGHLTRKNTNKNSGEQEVDNDVGKSMDEESVKKKEKAAIVIQSNFRGHLTRVGLKSTSDVIDDFDPQEEQDRSYAASDSEEEDLNYSPLKSSKYDMDSQLPSKSLNDTFLYNNKSQEN